MNKVTEVQEIAKAQLRELLDHKDFQHTSEHIIFEAFTKGWNAHKYAQVRTGLRGQPLIQDIIVESTPGSDDDNSITITWDDF